MGVTKGFAFIDNSYTCTQNSNTSIKEIHLSSLNNLKVAIDFTGMLHRFMREKTSNENHYILEIINIIEKLKKYNIIPIFVIDGRPIPEKQSNTKKIKDKSLDMLDTIITSLNTEINSESPEKTLEKLEKINKLRKKVFLLQKNILINVKIYLII